MDVCSMIPGAVWPAVPTARASQLLAIQFQLERSQWFSPDEILRNQKRQLWPLYCHAYERVPFYRQRMDAARLPPAQLRGPDDWRRLPVLTRDDVQIAGESLYGQPRLTEHGQLSQTLTSGSTGMPVLTLGTTVSRMMWSAITLRQHLWANRNFRGKLAIIRELNTPSASEQRTDNWGLGTLDVVETGPAVTLDVHSSIERQADWLAEHDPDYLLTYPSVARALAEQFRAANLRLSRLRDVRTFGEVLDPHVRRICHEVWNVPVVDAYSTQEVGYIALQCPEHEHYHVQSESVLLEVLDDDGWPCEPGEVGRVVVTALRGFAMPLLRYDLGDYAEVGEACPCGRGLPVLRRILGRKRNMFVLPTGERRWPCLDASAEGLPSLLAVVRQFQVVQTGLDRLEVRLRTPRPLTPEEAAVVRRTLRSALGYDFEIDLQYVDAIPRSASGKYEDFRCELDLDDGAAERAAEVASACPRA